MLPARYKWLLDEPGPKALLVAVGLYGTFETPGHANNPGIIRMAGKIAELFPSNYNQWASTFYDDDGIAWCGLFAAFCEAMAGHAPVDKYLSALAWRKYGAPVANPMLGDLLIKPRSGGGHVTRYVAEDPTHYHCIGGNQSDGVNIVRYPKMGVAWTFRRASYRVQPSNVRVVHVAASGTPA